MFNKKIAITINKPCEVKQIVLGETNTFVFEVDYVLSDESYERVYKQLEKLVINGKKPKILLIDGGIHLRAVIQ